jgi:hypothetical protein
MIEPVLTSGTVPLADVISVRAASGRVLLPSTQFARFEHISGMPTTGQGAYSITKLRILDALLDRMALLKGERPETKTEGISDAGLDKIIDELQDHVRESLKNAAATPFGAALGVGSSEAGLLFNYLI